MSALSLRLPNSLHDHARELARMEGISINQLVATALAEKMAALLTEEYFGRRAKGASRAKFLAALSKVPDVEPAPHDRLRDASLPSNFPGRVKTRRVIKRSGSARKPRRSE